MTTYIYLFAINGLLPAASLVTCRKLLYRLEMLEARQEQTFCRKAYEGGRRRSYNRWGEENLAPLCLYKSDLVCSPCLNEVFLIAPVIQHMKLLHVEYIIFKFRCQQKNAYFCFAHSFEKASFNSASALDKRENILYNIL